MLADTCAISTRTHTYTHTRTRTPTRTLTHTHTHFRWARISVNLQASLLGTWRHDSNHYLNKYTSTNLRWCKNALRRMSVLFGHLQTSENIHVYTYASANECTLRVETRRHAFLKRLLASTDGHLPVIFPRPKHASFWKHACVLPRAYQSNVMWVLFACAFSKLCVLQVAWLTEKARARLQFPAWQKLPELVLCPRDGMTRPNNCTCTSVIGERGDPRPRTLKRWRTHRTWI